MLHRVFAVASVGRLRDLRLPWLHGETSSRRLNRRPTTKENDQKIYPVDPLQLACS